jgi:hypothetical protein
MVPVVSWASTPVALAARNASASPTMPVRIVCSSSALINLLVSGNIHAGFDVVIHHVTPATRSKNPPRVQGSLTINV